MHISVLAAVWSGVAFILYRIVAYTLEELRHRRKAKELGCEEPYRFHNPDGFGIVLLVRTLKALGEYRLPQLAKQRAEEASAQEGRLITMFAQSLLGLTVYTTTDPKNIQTILATKFKDFGLGDLRYKIFGTLLGDGIFATDGEPWAHARAFLRPQFARDQVSDLDLEERHLQHLFMHIPSAPGSWTPVIDIKPLFFNLTIDSATEFLFGQSTDSQLSSLPGYKPSEIVTTRVSPQEFAVAFDAAQRTIGDASLFGDLYWMQFTKPFWKNVKICHDFMDHYVQVGLSREKTESRGVTSSGKKKFVFLDGLIESTRDPIELRNHMLNILLAGRDTTASLLSFVFMSLARNPQIYARLRATIVESFGTYNHPRNITFETLKSCSYLQWTLNETLRLYPVVPFDSRRALADTVLPNGGGPNGTSPVYIRKGTVVDYTVYLMHRRKDLWGEDAEVFRPERWEGRRSGWEYLPFNGGPRICIGQQFALTEAAYVVVRLLQRYEECVGVGNSWDPVEKGGYGFTRWKLTLTGSPADGVKVKFKEAED